MKIKNGLHVLDSTDQEWRQRGSVKSLIVDEQQLKWYVTNVLLSWRIKPVRLVKLCGKPFILAVYWMIFDSRNLKQSKTQFWGFVTKSGSKGSKNSLSTTHRTFWFEPRHWHLNINTLIIWLFSRSMQISWIWRGEAVFHFPCVQHINVKWCTVSAKLLSSTTELARIELIA